MCGTGRTGLPNLSVAHRIPDPRSVRRERGFGMSAG